MAQPLVRVEPQQGTWEVVGRDRFRGVTPENVRVDSNSYGPNTASFRLQRDPSLTHLDLAAFTPVEIVEDGVRIFEGRVKETPTQGGDSPGIDVQCEGWQYHLDDDLFEKMYVHSRLADWQDWRSDIRSDLAVHRAQWTVEASGGAITLAWPTGQPIRAIDAVGVFIEFPTPQIRRAVLDVDTSANSAAGFLQVLGYVPDETDADVLYSETLNTVGANATISGTAAQPISMLFVQLAYNSSATTVGGDGHWARLRGIRLFSDPAYESGNESVLKASQVVSDALTRAPLLNQTLDLPNGGTSFNIPDFYPSEARTVREYVDVANSYHRWRFQIGRDRTPRYSSHPTVPKYVFGGWGGGQFADQSANSGEDIYNRAILSANGPDGKPLRVERWSGQQPGVLYEPISTPSLTNPSADSGTYTGWGGHVRTSAAGTGTVGSSSIDNVIFESAPQGFKFAATPDSFYRETTFAGTFAAGTAYQLSVMTLVHYGTGPVSFSKLELVGSDNRVRSSTTIAGTGAFAQSVVSWMPRTNETGVKLRVHVGFNSTLWFDTIRVYKASPTLVDKRGFIRSKLVSVSSALVPEAAVQILDAWLQTHTKTPFRGGGTFFPGDIRDYQSGRDVHPRELVFDGPGELVHFAHLIDPDTGALGRDGVLADVSYDTDSEAAQIAVDSSRDNLEAVLSRLALVSG